VAGGIADVVDDQMRLGEWLPRTVLHLKAGREWRALRASRRDGTVTGSNRGQTAAEASLNRPPPVRGAFSDIGGVVTCGGSLKSLGICLTIESQSALPIAAVAADMLFPAVHPTPLVTPHSVVAGPR